MTREHLAREQEGAAGRRARSPRYRDDRYRRAAPPRGPPDGDRQLQAQSRYGGDRADRQERGERAEIAGEAGLAGRRGTGTTYASASDSRSRRRSPPGRRGRSRAACHDLLRVVFPYRRGPHLPTLRSPANDRARAPLAAATHPACAGHSGGLRRSARRSGCPAVSQVNDFRVHLRGGAHRVPPLPIGDQLPHLVDEVVLVVGQQRRSGRRPSPRRRRRRRRNATVGVPRAPASTMVSPQPSFSDGVSATQAQASTGASRPRA